MASQEAAITAVNSVRDKFEDDTKLPTVQAGLARLDDNEWGIKIYLSGKPDKGLPATILGFVIVYVFNAPNSIDAY
jgi:hypothetical protein